MERIWSWTFLVWIGLKSTSLAGQDLSGAMHFYGLWEGYHPVEIRIDLEDEGVLVLPDEPVPVRVHAQHQADRWRILELASDGQIAGTWTIAPQADHWLGEWTNYNQSIGSLCALFDQPVTPPEAFSVRFGFKAGKQKWKVVLYPLPRGKWKGMAWLSDGRRVFPVIGEWMTKGITLSLEDPLSGQQATLELLTDRQAWRKATFTNPERHAEQVHLQDFRMIPITLERYLDFSREILLFQPAFDWPGWQTFLAGYLDEARNEFQEAFQDLQSGTEVNVPPLRHAVRLYAWVEWTWLDRDLASGILHIVDSWGPARHVPFTFGRREGRMTLASLWPEDGPPQKVREHFGDSNTWPPFRVNPSGMVIGQPGGEEWHVPASEVTEWLPKGHRLLRVFR